MACKLVAYLRVSTDGQARSGQGLGVQRQAVTRWAKANGHQIVGIEADEGVSGTLPAEQRPGLLRALQMIGSGEATALVVPDLSRLARLLHEQEAALDLVWSEGAKVYSADDGEVCRDDPDDPMRTAIRQMRGVMHQLDKALISKRLREGRRAKLASGGFGGGTVPYGYQLDSGYVLKDPDEQKMLRLARRRAAAGDSLRVIAHKLDAAGYVPRAGGSWHPQTVARMLRQAKT